MKSTKLFKSLVLWIIIPFITFLSFGLCDTRPSVFDTVYETVISITGEVTAIAYDLKALFTGPNTTFNDTDVIPSPYVETGILTVVDTSTGTAKIVGNELELVGNGASWTATGVIGAAVSRSLGKAGFFTLNNTSTTSTNFVGFYPSAAIGTNPSFAAYTSSQIMRYRHANSSGAIATIPKDVDYSILLLAGGYDSSGIPFVTGDTIGDFLYGFRFFIKGGTFTSWTLLWSDENRNDATLYYYATNFQVTGATLDNLLIPTEVLNVDTMFQPNFLDTFAGTNGDSLVNDHTPEVVDGATGTGNPWESGADTWDIQGSAAVNSGYTGTLNTSIVSDDQGITQGLFDVNITSTELYSGLIIALDSVASPANYVRVHYDFANGKVEAIKYVAGVPTSLISVVKAYSAGAQLRVITDYISATDDLKLKVYYNGALIGTEQTITEDGIAGNTRHGIMSTSSSNSLDNFTVHLRTNPAWDTLIDTDTGGIYGSIFIILSLFGIKKKWYADDYKTDIKKAV